jgi:spermidine/putrescine transport system substrate-binding protein
MKKSLIYVLLLLALVLSACAPAASEEPAAPSGGEEPAGEMSERCGDMSNSPTGSSSTPGSNISIPRSRTMFQEECGVEVVETNFDSNETLLATLQAGGADYDIIVPSDYMVQIMIDEGMLMELDYSVITNMQHMDPLNVNQYFDPEQKYTVPWFWGTSGFAVDTNVVTDYTDSWSMMFDPNSPYCGQISMLDDQRETLGAALMYLGYSLNSIQTPRNLKRQRTCSSSSPPVHQGI